jgi:hypothetical protein
MTDTFDNGPSAPGGATPNETQQAGDVTGTLAELEHKLRELEHELTSIGRRRELAGATPAQNAATGSPTQISGRLVDEAIEPPAAVESPAPATPATSAIPTAPSPTTPAAPATPVVPTGAGQPVKFMRPLESARSLGSREPAGRSELRVEDEPHIGSEPHIESEPRSESEPGWTPTQPERPRPSEAQLASLAELRRFRDRLERFARDLAAEYDALLGRVMSGLTSASPPASSPPAHTPPGAPPAAHTPSASDPPATASAATTPPRGTRESPDDALFEGRVELGVGPFYDIASLSAFERRLASLPHVVEASVRRFEASHAVVDVRLAAPVALVRELRRTAETDFSVREVAAGRILLTFDET